jgi:6-phosphogluconolactonase
MPAQPEISILKTAAELFEVAAAEFAAQANQGVRDKGRFAVALSGGSTPRALYSLLATKSNIPWDKICFFWGDERHVPPDNPESNYRMANESLLSKVPVPPANVFRVLAENPDAGAAASAYEQTIQSFFHLDAANPFPNFDLILLGIGPDGHTASLFPGTKALLEQSRLVVANLVDKLNTDRITLTYPVLNAAHCVLFLVSGLDKAPALQEVLEGTGAVETYPAKGVRPEEGRLVWIADRAAASMLQRTGKSEG